MQQQRCLQKCSDRKPHVIIIGGGFGGLTAAKALAKAPVSVTLVDCRNHHLFQPLLYQVAMAGLSPADIAAPIRSVLRRQKNCMVLLDEAVGVEFETKHVCLRNLKQVAYDYLIIAAGAKTNFYGNDAWAEKAVGLKSLDDAVEVRRRVLIAFEIAESERASERRKELLTFVVIGGGPTGVELAGALRELSRTILKRDFRTIRPEDTRVMLVEAGPTILNGFDATLSASAVRQLSELGVEVLTNNKVEVIDDNGVVLSSGRIPSKTVIWAAGVKPVSLAAVLDVARDRQGRILVEQDCSLPNHPEVFAIGDIVCFRNEHGRCLPGISPVAMQQARHVADVIVASIEGKQRKHFRYIDKGIMATIGRSRAVAQSGPLRLSGFIAWLAWLFVHLWYLVTFRNRVFVLLQWCWAYLGYRPGARLITGQRMKPGAPRAQDSVGHDKRSTFNNGRAAASRT